MDLLNAEEISWLDDAIRQMDENMPVMLSDAADRCLEGMSVEEVYGKDSFGEHELRHSIAMVAHMVSEFLVEHPCTAINPNVARMLAIAEQSLHDAYTTLGNGDPEDD